MFETVIWYVWIQVIATVGWLVSRSWLGSLPSSGYGASKALGVLLVGYVYWAAITFGLARNGAGAALLAIVVIAMVGTWLQSRHPRAQQQPLGIALSFGARSDALRRTFALSLTPAQMATEVVFAVAFIACAVYRSYNPTIDSAGGEKYMDYMMFNAILRSDTFPPTDAWLSGYAISYYYFGYVQQSMIQMLAGVSRGVAFNLSGATTFALTCAAAFGVGYDLWAAHLARNEPVLAPSVGVPHAASTFSRRQNSPILAGLLTATMLACMGNLGGLIESGRCSGVLGKPLMQWLDIRNKATDPIECAGLVPTRFYWWWDWSRVVHDRTPTGGDQEAIAEFPAFSFALGDNHPHVMNLPFVILAVAIALALYLREDGDRWPNVPALANEKREIELTPALGRDIGMFIWRSLQPIDELFLTSVIVGALSFMNTWDFPIFGGLVLGASILKRWLRAQSTAGPVIYAGVSFALAYALYFPWYGTFASQARGIGINLFNGTSFVQFFVQFAPFVIALPAFLFLTARRQSMPILATVGRALALTGCGLVLILLGAAGIGLLSPQLRGLLEEMNRTGAVLGIPRATAIQAIVGRLGHLAEPLFLLMIVAVTILLLSTIRNNRGNATSSTASIQSFVTVLFAIGALVAGSVEFVFLLDNFGTRMNSIFKFWYMTWNLWSIGSAFAVMLFISTRRVASGVVTAVILLLGACGLLYPIFTALSRTGNFVGPATLDGSAYLQQYHPADAKTIDWFNTSVSGAPVVAEAPADKGGSYKYEGRISAFTGLPTPLGWGGHESQWRGNYDVPGRREPQVESFFNTTDTAEYKRLATTLDVTYVVVGDVERKRYDAAGLEKFARVGKTVFVSGDTVVYKIK